MAHDSVPLFGVELVGLLLADVAVVEVDVPEAAQAVDPDVFHQMETWASEDADSIAPVRRVLPQVFLGEGLHHDVGLCDLAELLVVRSSTRRRL